MRVLECDTTFLMTQVEHAKLEVLLLNLIKITGKFPVLQEMAIGHACSSILLPLLGHKTILELQLIPFLFTSPPSTSSIIFNSPLAGSSSLLSLLSSLIPTSVNFITSVVEKLVLLLTPTHLSTVLSTPYLLSNTSLATTLLSLSPQLLSGSNELSISFAKLINNLLKDVNIEKITTGEDVASLAIEAR